MVKRNEIHLKWIFSIIFIIVGIFIFTLSWAGDLEPSAKPAPTMKTLDEIEPRIPIPGSSTAVSEFIINESGSYYLAGNRVCNTNGIQVNADNVTIDLMGYSLTGPGSTGYGVSIDGRSNVEIKNGTITGFYRGINDSKGTGNGHCVINVRCIYNSSSGIYLSVQGALVKGCTVRNNGDTSSAIVYGIFVRHGSTVTDNRVMRNGQHAGAEVYGIDAQDHCLVTNNVVFANGSLAGDKVYGIRAMEGTLISNNSVNYNGASCSHTVYGIFASQRTVVTNNISTNNGHFGNSNGCGIFTGEFSLIDQNAAYSNYPTNYSGCTACMKGVNYPPVPNL